MASKRKKGKWTQAEIKDHTKRIAAIVHKLERERQHENFIGITAEELAKKFKRANSPMIITNSWGSTTPGGTLNASVVVYNPNPTAAGRLVLHFWVGSGNVDPNLGTFLNNVDARFARLSDGQPFGFTLAPGASRTVSFALPVPASIERSSYMANSCLMRIDSFDQGTYLDRGALVFGVV